MNTTIIAKGTTQMWNPLDSSYEPAFGVPDDVYTTTWWSSGPAPGDNGLAVILGHSLVGSYAVFNELDTLHTGDIVGVQSGPSGSSVTYGFAVRRIVSGISKTDPNALRNVLAAPVTGSWLALITCSGPFNTSYHESMDNTVVFAQLVGSG